jgi:hypothetical protein
MHLVNHVFKFWCDFISAAVGVNSVILLVRGMVSLLSLSACSIAPSCSAFIKTIFFEKKDH